MNRILANLSKKINNPNLYMRIGVHTVFSLLLLFFFKPCFSFQLKQNPKYIII